MLRSLILAIILSVQPVVASDQYRSPDLQSSFKNQAVDQTRLMEAQKCLDLISQAQKQFRKDNDKDGLLLCDQLLIEITDPTQVNQGNHDTCALAALQVKLYYDCPSIVVKTVLEAKKGSLKYFPVRCIKPDIGAQRFKSGSVFRSYPSQLFQIALANLYWSNQEADSRGMEVKKGSVSYIEGYESKPFFKGDTGDRLVIDWKDYKEVVSSNNLLPEDGPVFTAQRMTEVYRLLTGNCQDDLVCKHDQLGGKFKNELELANLFNPAQLPVILMVKTSGRLDSIPRFTTAVKLNGTVKFNDQEKWHVVVVTWCDGKTANLDNFWGAAHDTTKIPIGDLYQSTIPTTKSPGDVRI